MSFTVWPYAVFLLTALAGYWIVPFLRWRNLLLLGASLFFYGYVHPRLILLLLVATIAAYFGALLVEFCPRLRSWMYVAGITSLVGLLGFFKYSDFLAENLRYFADADAAAATLEEALRATYRWLGLEAGINPLLPPLGISFFIFQCIGYLVDVYRRQERAQKNPLAVLLFISFFPQLVAGPIERAGHLLPQLAAPRRWQWQNLTLAAPLILRGLIKKLAIADNLAPFADRVFALDAPSGPLLYAGTVAFALQIYGDFSGYTDIARGSARLFGIDLLENFRSPYLALTPADFWRRWHISFSRWVRDYLYLPLGGSRGAGPVRLFAVLLAVFGLSGLWHGAAWHYAAWGLYHGTLVYLCHLSGTHGKQWRPRGKIYTVLCWLAMIHLTLLGWLLFRTPDMSWLTSTLMQAGAAGMPGEANAALRMLGAAVFYSLPLAGFLYLERGAQSASAAKVFVRGVLYALLFCWLVLIAKGGNYNFIYFQF